MTDNFCEGPGNWRKLSWPVCYFVGPAQPGGFVRFPFCWHAEVLGVWGFDWSFGFHGNVEFNTECSEVTEEAEHCVLARETGIRRCSRKAVLRLFKSEVA